MVTGNKGVTHTQIPDPWFWWEIHNAFRPQTFTDEINVKEVVIWLKGIVPQKKFYLTNIIFWIVIGVWYSSFWSEGPKNHLKFWSQSWSTSREGVGQGTWLARFSSGIQHQSHNWGSPFIDHNPDFRDGKVPECNIFCQLCEGLEGNKILSGISLGGSRKYPGGADEDCKDWGHTQKV